MSTILKIQNINSWLYTDNKQLKNKLWNALRFPERGYFHSTAYKKGVWDGYKEFFNKNSGMFLTGLLPEILATLKLFKIPYEIVDERNSVKWQYPSIDKNFLNQWLPEGKDPIELHDYQVDYVNQAIKYDRGIIKSPTGCHRKGQKIIKYGGELIAVENIKTGDYLTGPDSKPRKVLNLCRGTDVMYKIKPNKGKSFIVNENHILTLVRTKSGNRYPSERESGTLIDVSVKEWLTWSNWKKHIHKLIRVGVEFENKYNNKTSPYLIGLLLGDGSLQHTPALHNVNPTLIEVAKREAKIRNLELKTRKKNEGSVSHFFVGKKKHQNPLALELKELGLWNCVCENKFIPQILKTSDRTTRLQLLSGLVDTDGSLEKNCYYITSKSKQLAKDIAWVSRSLGFYSKVSKTIKTSQNGTSDVYFCVSICGDIDQIPSLIKPAKPRKQKKNVCRTGFQIEKVCDSEEYFGFTLSGDGRYLLDDFTVTHNSGKTFIMISIMKCLPPKTPILFMTKNSGLVDQNYNDMKEWGIQDLGRWYGGHKELNRVMCVTAHTSTYDNLRKLLPKFKVLIVDEIHECMSEVPMKIYKSMKGTSIRFGISATPFKFTKKNDKGEEVCNDKVHKFKTKGYFGGVFKTKTTASGTLSTKDLQERGILSASQCTFYPVTTPVTIRNEPYMDAVTLGISNNFEFLKTVKRLALTMQGRTLILVERIDQGEYLNQLIPGSIWLQGKDDLNTRAAAFKELKYSGEKVVAIAMRQIISAGINVFLHNLINAAGGKAEHSIIQQMGRGLRCANDKAVLDYYDFIFHTNDYLTNHSNQRLDTLANEGHKITIKSDIDF